MDESRRSFPHQAMCERIGAVPRVAAAVEKSAIPAGRLPAEPPQPKDPQIVFYGDAQQVREGFAIALRAMGLEANFLPSDMPGPATHPNREDH